jgi:large subunit ribosomal protein L32
MAVPKFKVSKSRSRRRRSINMKKSIPHLSECTNCGQFGLRHRVCSTCGYYRGKQIIQIEA